MTQYCSKKFSTELHNKIYYSAATAFGAPLDEFGDGGGHLGSAAAAWLGGVLVWFLEPSICDVITVESFLGSPPYPKLWKKYKKPYPRFYRFCYKNPLN